MSSNSESVNQPVKKTPKVTIRISCQMKERLDLKLAELNRKPYGRKIKHDALIGLLLSKITEKDLYEIQEQSLTGSDRLNRSYNAYCEKFGKISKDDYYLRLLKINDSELKNGNASVNEQK